MDGPRRRGEPSSSIGTGREVAESRRASEEARRSRPESKEGRGAAIAAVAVRTDEEIQREVLSELKWDARVLPNEIGVAIKDGVMTLTGWVDSHVKKWAVEKLANVTGA